MIVLHTWSIIAALAFAFLFGFGIGRTCGESRAWAKMDEEEKEQVE